MNTDLNIRRAKPTDIDGIRRLLMQVLEIHRMGRPDIFKKSDGKYTDDELNEIIRDDNRPIFVCLNETGVVGYAFCVIKQVKNDNILTDIKTLYIDDLCVDEGQRGKRIGKTLFEYTLDFARAVGCYNITLNVWSCNQNAIKFYENCGLVPQKTVMEKIL